MKHLSSQEISEWMLGERTLETESHLRECVQCQAQLNSFQSSLATFRDAMHNVKVPELQSGWRDVPSRSDFGAHRLRWVAVATLLLMVAAIPVLRFRDSSQRQLAAATQDAILLEQVNAAVSRSVPQPFEPLARLSSSSDQTEKKESQ